MIILPHIIERIMVPAFYPKERKDACGQAVAVRNTDP